jgi:hypothetical protein
MIIAFAQSWLLVVTGIGGTPQYDSLFAAETTALITATHIRLGVPDDHIVRATTTDATVHALADVAAHAGPTDVVAVVLIGHGSALGGSPRLNLAGPDLTAELLAHALVPFQAQEIVVVNTASASGPWIDALAGPRRTVITATRSAAERDETVFARYFAEAFGNDAGDTDKDGRLSVLEAFEYARAAVDRHYTASHHLKTEHALLESDGDGRGSLTPATDSDGRRPATLFLDAPRVASGDTVLTALFARRDSLQRALSALETRRPTTVSTDSTVLTAFNRELEALLLEIAQNGRAIRDRQGARP